MSNSISKRVLFFLLMLVIAQQGIAQERKDSVRMERIRFLQQSLKHDQQGTRLWWYSWLGIYGTATIGQGAAYFSSTDKSTRQDMALGAATTFLGVAGQFISPFRALSYADKAMALPEGNLLEKEAKLAQLAQLLSDRALMEEQARKWQAHILPTSINLASGLITWLGFHRTVWDGVVNFGLNCVLTESQIWSQPLRAKKALKRYRESYGNPNLSRHPGREFNWNFIVSTGGAGVRVTF